MKPGMLAFTDQYGECEWKGNTRPRAYLFHEGHKTPAKVNHWSKRPTFSSKNNVNGYFFVGRS